MAEPVAPPHTAPDPPNIDESEGLESAESQSRLNLEAIIDREGQKLSIDIAPSLNTSVQLPLKPTEVGSLAREARDRDAEQHHERIHVSPSRFLSQPRTKPVDQPPNGQALDTKPAEDYNTAQALAKLFFASIIIGFVFIATCTSQLSLVAFRPVVATASGQGQLLLMMMVPVGGVLLFSLCLTLVRERNIDHSERLLTIPIILGLGFAEGLFEALANVLFVEYVLGQATAQGSVVLVLAAVLWNIGPLGMLILKMSALRVEPGPFTPFGLPLGLVWVGVAIGLGAAIVGLVLTMVAGQLWWQAPVLAILGAFAHWDNFAPSLSSPILRSLISRRHFLAAWKAFVKLSATILWVMLFASVKFSVSPGDLWSSMGSINSSPSVTQFYLQVFSGLVGFGAMWLGNLLFFRRIAAGLPLLLTTPVCVILYETLLTHGSGFFYGVSFPSEPLQGINLGLVCAAAVLAVASACGAMYYFFHKRFDLPILLAERDLWSRPGWDFVLLPSLALNSRRAPRATAEKSRHVDHSRDLMRHRTFILATMWHEGEEEMRYMLRSLLSLSQEVTDKSEKYEAHIVFDDAIKDDDANTYVQQLFRVMEDAGLHISDPVETWYGYAVAVLLPGCLTAIVHLKNVKLVKQKKRWSQNLALEVILSSMAQQPLATFEQTYLLLLDGDTRFTKRDVDILRARLVEDPGHVGAVCGRIVPDVTPANTNPMIWYQFFEYAAAHWLSKASENVFGSILCCPGCFTLMRFSALVRRAGSTVWSEWAETSLAVYTREAESAMDVLMLEQGEDRMLSTQLILNGWLLQYCADARAITFCPDSFNSFFTQRRRWNSSTIANLYYLLSESGTILKRNGAISIWYIASTVLSLLASFVAPAMVVLVIIGALIFALGVNTALSYVIGLGLPLFYLLICCIYHIDMSDPNMTKKARKFEIQTAAAFILCGIYVILMAVVIVGLVVQIVNAITSGVWNVEVILILLFLIIYVVAALVHGELAMLFRLPVYLLLLPTMVLILTIFCVMNLHDQSWGTRDAAPSEGPIVKENLGFWRLGWTEVVAGCTKGPGSVEFTPVSRWLADNGLAEYSIIFSNHGFDLLESLSGLRPEMFDALNIKLGHRAILEKALEKLAANRSRPAGPARETKALHREVSRRMRKEKELELTELFSTVRDARIREFLKRLHNSLKFTTVGTVRQKTELADLQRRFGYCLLVISLSTFAITLAFNYQFGSDTATYGTGPYFQINYARMAGYVIIFCYVAVLLMQFVGMLIYRFGIFLYTLHRWSISDCHCTGVYTQPEVPARV